ncbi:MAG: sialate O-acetylesterase [Lachnospiraceae bacterium]|nr:sialate O-acetylesterase [Lachnospiraceae bacterium]
MKKAKTLRFLLLGAALFLTALLSMPARALAEDTVDTTTIQTKVEVPIKVIKEKKKIYLICGEKRTMNIGGMGPVLFSSSDPKIVGVNGLGQMIGMKAGKAVVSIQTQSVRQEYTVVVRDTVDLVIFAGQSNMAGAGGNYTMAPTPDAGTAYEFNIATSDEQKIIMMKEPFGNGTNRAYMLNGRYMSGNGTLCSAFSVAYYKKTKVPVVGVPCAWGGTTSSTWLTSGILEASISRMKQAKSYLRKHKCKVRHIYVVWYQGESDGQKGYSPDTYVANTKKIWSKFKKAGCEKMFMIRIAQMIGCPGMMDPIANAQSKLCKENKAFIMASTEGYNMHEDPGKWYSDIIHINQSGLNKIGTAAGNVAGKYAKKSKKKAK